MLNIFNWYGKEVKYNDKYGLSYGHDYVVGLFVIVWKLDSTYPHSHLINTPDYNDNMIVSTNSFKNETLTVKDIAEEKSTPSLDEKDNQGAKVGVGKESRQRQDKKV